MNLEEFTKNLTEIGSISEGGSSGFRILYSNFELRIGINLEQGWLQMKWSYLGQSGFKRESLPEDFSLIWEEIWKKYQEYLEFFQKAHRILL
jgi:hypothetical protein